MSKLDELTGRGFVWVAKRLTMGQAAGLAALLYAGFGLALPLGLRWPVFWMVLANVLATLLAGVLLLTWLSLQLDQANRRRLLEWTTNLRLLTAEEFEWLVGEVFRREGWEVEETGRQDAPDGNVDLRLSRGGETSIVQCKRWVSQPVGVDEIRKFGGTLLRESLVGRAGVFVTLSDFTEQARVEAEKMGLALIDKHDLLARMDRVRRTEPCPTCNAPMRLGRSQYGWWLRCVAPGCAGKRDLSTDAGRAAELLTASG